MTFRILITPDDLKAFCNISNSYDADKLTPLIYQAQSIALEQILGTALTESLKNKYIDLELADKYLALHNLVVPTLCFQTFTMFLPNLAVNIANAGISVGQGEGTQTLTENRIAALQRSSDATRVIWENKVKDYLLRYQEDFPELKTDLPAYLRPNLASSDASQGFTASPNFYYDNF